MPEFKPTQSSAFPRKSRRTCSWQCDHCPAEETQRKYNITKATEDRRILN